MAERYVTIARTLIREIAQGRYASDLPLPRRVELARRFGVTRSTIDRGIAVLVRRGLLTSQQGSGTFLRQSHASFSVALVGRPPQSLSLACPDCRIEVLSEESLASGARRATLGAYDGILWYLPSSRALCWVAEAEGAVPQIVINRHLPERNHVSTAHRDAIRGITGERLRTIPEAAPLFLRPQRDPEDVVCTMREEGFVDACREARRFYEVVEMPPSFEQKLRSLEQLASRGAGKPILLVSAGIDQTGAVMAWARERSRRWRRDLWYSDFDDDQGVLTWGVKVTSFLQDYQRLTDLAVEGLASILQGRERSVKTVIPPIRVDGDT